MKIMAFAIALLLFVAPAAKTLAEREACCETSQEPVWTTPDTCCRMSAAPEPVSPARVAAAPEVAGPAIAELAGPENVTPARPASIVLRTNSYKSPSNAPLRI